MKWLLNFYLVMLCLVGCSLSIVLFYTHSLLLHLYRFWVRLVSSTSSPFFEAVNELWKVVVCHSDGPSCSLFMFFSILEPLRIVLCFKFYLIVLMVCTRDNQILIFFVIKNKFFCFYVILVILSTFSYWFVGLRLTCLDCNKWVSSHSFSCRDNIFYSSDKKIIILNLHLNN